jgi:hypothetical protein
MSALQPPGKANLVTVPPGDEWHLSRTYSQSMKPLVIVNENALSRGGDFSSSKGYFGRGQATPFDSKNLDTCSCNTSGT